MANRIVTLLAGSLVFALGFILISAVLVRLGVSFPGITVAAGILAGIGLTVWLADFVKYLVRGPSEAEKIQIERLKLEKAATLTVWNEHVARKARNMKWAHEEFLREIRERKERAEAERRFSEQTRRENELAKQRRAQEAEQARVKREAKDKEMKAVAEEWTRSHPPTSSEPYEPRDTTLPERHRGAVGEVDEYEHAASHGVTYNPIYPGFDNT